MSICSGQNNSFPFYAQLSWLIIQVTFRLDNLLNSCSFYPTCAWIQKVLKSAKATQAYLSSLLQTKPHLKFNIINTQKSDNTIMKKKRKTPITLWINQKFWNCYDSNWWHFSCKGNSVYLKFVRHIIAEALSSFLLSHTWRYPHLSVIFNHYGNNSEKR